MPRASELVAAASRYVGVRIKHRGSDASGCDCVGVIVAALRDVGVVVDHGVEYGTWPSEAKLTAGLERFCDRWVGPWAPGTVLQVFAGREARHLCLVVGPDRSGQTLVVQAWGRQGCVKVTVLTDRVASAWRVKGVEYDG